MNLIDRRERLLRDEGKARKGAAAILWIMFLVVAVIWLGKRSYEWDLLAYSACAMELSQDDPVALHAVVYAMLDAQAPPRDATALRSKNEYRVRLSEDAAAFAAQLPFYRGRVLYIGAIAALGLLGSSPIDAAFLVSWASGALLLIALGLWLRRRGGGSLGLVIGNLLVLTALGFYFKTPTKATPDALAAALLIWGAFLLIETRRSTLGLALLGLSLAARVDHIVLIVPLVAWCAYGRTPCERLSSRRLAAAALLFVSVVLACSLGRETYGPWTTFHHTFIEYKAFPAGETPPFDLALWAKQVLHSLPKFKSFPPLLFTLSGCVAAVTGYRRGGWRDPGLGLAGVALTAIAVHFALFPALWPRLMFPYWVLAALAMGSSVAPGRDGQLEAQLRSDQASP